MRAKALLVTFGICMVLLNLGLQGAAFANGSAGEILVNGDFGKGFDGWSVPTSAVIDQKIFKSGKQSLKITRAATGDSLIQREGWATAAQSVKVEGGAVYRISLWVKLQNAYQSAARVQWYDKDEKLLGTVFPLTGRDGTVDWFSVSTLVSLPKEATQLNLALLGGAGITWFDGVKMELVPAGKRIIPQAEWLQITQAKYGKDMIAPAMREKVVYYDKRYDSSWVANVENLLTFLNFRGFTTLDADQLRTWMQRKIKKGADGTVCILAMGIIPDTISESYDAQCTLRKYLDAGGRAVWIGDIPLGYISFRDKAFDFGAGPELVLGIRYGTWNQNKSPKITPEGERWGMRVLDTAAKARTYLAGTTSLVFSDVPGTSDVCSFFVNYNPDFTYSGFLRYGHGYDGKNAALNQDLYRLALYRGKPVEVPEVAREKEIEKPPAVTVETPMRNYPRGYIIPITINTAEGLRADKVRLTVEDGKRAVKEMEASFGKENILSLETKDLASREYTLIAELLANGRITGQATRKICLVPQKTGKLPIGVPRMNVPDSEYKSDVILKDLKEHLGECGVTNGGGYFGDEALKYGLRVIEKSTAYYANMVPIGEHPELQMRLASGELPKYHYSYYAGFAPVCMGNPINRQKINETFKAEIRNALKYPAFMKRMYVSDDNALFGEPEKKLLVCYCEYCKGEFKRLTGFDAPLVPSPEILNKKGVVSDNDPWYLWMKFRSKNTYGGWNKSMEEAKNEIDPEIKFGPVCAGGSSPVLNPQWGLNPPDDYGDIGMASYYYYPFYSSCFRFLTLSAQAMMGNRDKELWVDALASDFYKNMNNPADVTRMVRSEFYYLLAAGVKGMTYFLYSGMTGTPAWEEFKNFSRIGTDFGPFILKLNRPSAKVGMLASYCNASYGGSGANEDLYRSFARAHIPVDFVADEEVLACRLKNYQVLVLTGADYLTQSVYNKMAEFISSGGVVLKDESSKIDVPGSEILTSDAQIIERSRAAVNPYFEVNTPNLIVTEFTANDARYLMVVNDQTINTTEGVITLKGMKGYQPYDIFAGQAIKVDGDGRFTLTIEPAGGKLIGVYPSGVADVSLQMPEKVSRGQRSSLGIEIRGSDGTPLKGLLPVQVKISDLQGNETEYSDYYVADNGKLDISFSPAINDLKGKWEAEVRELSSGISKKLSFVVE